MGALMHLSELRNKLANHPTALEYLDGRYDHGNWLPTALVTIAFACMGTGIDYDGYVYLVNHSELTDDPKQADKVSRMIQGRWEFAEDHFEEGSIDLVREAASDLHERIFWTHFPSGQAGISQRLVALAFARHAVKHGAYTFNASVRYLSQESGVSDIKVVSKARTALQELGLIEVIEQNGYGLKFKLDLRWLPPAAGVLRTEQLNTPTNNLVHHIVCRESEPFRFFYAHDLFAKDGLGPVAGFVLSACPPGAKVKSEDVANALGISPATIKRAVKTLIENGLATSIRGGLTTHELSSNDLDVLALKLGCGNWREKQREKHAPQQAEYATNREMVLSARLQQAHEHQAAIAATHELIAQEHARFLAENISHREYEVTWSEDVEWLSQRPDPFCDEPIPVEPIAALDPFAA
jgi:DNA-binding transcriptional regulator YhcF (GntR family)